MTISSRGILRKTHGFDFPDDVHALWELARRVGPADPRLVLRPLGLRLSGPFDCLAKPGPFVLGEVWKRQRLVEEPPELFVLLESAALGSTSSGFRRWGYYLDDPSSGSGCVGSHSPIGPAVIMGQSLLGTIRGIVERLGGELEAIVKRSRASEKTTLLPPPASISRDEKGSPDHNVRSLRPVSVAQQIETLGRLHEALLSFGAPEPEPSNDDLRQRALTAPTLDGWGLVVPASSYEASTSARATLSEGSDFATLEMGAQALRDGYPGTALKIAKDLSRSLDLRRERDEAAGAVKAKSACFELSAGAYESLGREPLARISRWQASRWQPPAGLNPFDGDAC